MTSLYASLLQMISTGKDHLCQITLNWKLSHKFKKGCQFSSLVKVKLRKKKLHKTIPACTASFRNFTLTAYSHITANTIRLMNHRGPFLTFIAKYERFTYYGLSEETQNIFTVSGRCTVCFDSLCISTVESWHANSSHKGLQCLDQAKVNDINNFFSVKCTAVHLFHCTQR